MRTICAALAIITAGAFAALRVHAAPIEPAAAADKLATPTAIATPVTNAATANAPATTANAPATTANAPAATANMTPANTTAPQRPTIHHVLIISEDGLR